MVNLSSFDRTPLSPPADQRIPPLENGDRLTRHEFERRYAAASDIAKAELIEGVVYLASPLRYRSHARPHSQLILWLGTYEINTPHVELSIEPTIRLDSEHQTFVQKLAESMS